MTAHHPQEELVIARFAENHLGRKQVVTLFADRVEVSGSNGFSNDYEWQAPLTSLSPTVQRGRSRNPLTFRGLMLLVAWLVVFMTLAEIPGVQLQSRS